MKHNVFSLDTLFKISYELKQQGKTIALTHGTFDLFHYTHLDLLRKASQIADVLMVGVESDRMVQEYKPNRPIIDENSRVDIVGQASSVDFTFVKDLEFESIQHIKLYEDLGIDCLIIGDTYHPDGKKRVGYDCKQSKVDLIEQHPERRYSTTGIINTIEAPRVVKKDEIE